MTIATCHCGAVTITVETPPERLTECNCSLCRRVGGLWAYYPTEQVKVEAAPGATEAYVQGDGMLATHHCVRCGCVTHWVPTEKGDPGRMAVNARMMDPAVVAAAPVRHFDGADTWTFLD